MKSDEPYDHLVKVLLIGESGVGKTCILQRFNKGDFLINHLTTIAIDFKMKIYDVNGTKLKMQIWDTAGQERFNTLTSNFFKTAQGIVVVYSVTDEQSFQSINKWVSQIQNLAPKHVKVLLVGNKTDLENDRVISIEQGIECAKKFGFPFVEASAFSGENINEVFKKIGEQILEEINIEKSMAEPGDNLKPKPKQDECCK